MGNDARSRCLEADAHVECPMLDFSRLCIRCLKTESKYDEGEAAN